jgi:hypothetical protein
VEVTFTKLAGRRYEMAIIREHGPQLEPRGGPGYHDFLPHDAIHFLVEAEAGLAGGAFGRIADGESNIFAVADPALRRRQHRREKARRPTPGQHADMATSEMLAGACQRLWELRAGHIAALPEWFSLIDPETLKPDLVQRILRRLDTFAELWHPLPVGGSITLAWPLSDRARRSRKHGSARKPPSTQAQPEVSA